MYRTRIFYVILVCWGIIGCTFGNQIRPNTGIDPTSTNVLQVPIPSFTPTLGLSDISAPELQVDRSKLSERLILYNWEDYIDSSIIDDFEKEYGVEIVVMNFENNQDLIAVLRQGESQ